MKSNSTIVVMNKNNRSLRAQRGQTIVIALLVLLLLAFVGGLFVTIVAKNLGNAKTAGVVQTADDYAQSGMRFADDQLVNSLDGADWRPVRVNPALVSPNDPDADYLIAGYTRYDTGNGRFLVRVTYNPLGYNPANGNVTQLNDPLARYLKIESVGRDGKVDSTDPTSFKTASRGTSIAKIVGYVPIAITDYGHYITDIDRRAEVANIGVPSIYDATSGLTTPGVLDFIPNNANRSPATVQTFPIKTTLGALDAYLPITIPGVGVVNTPNPYAGSSTITPGAVSGGGTFHANTSVRFFGENDIYLDRPGPSGTGSNAEQVEIAGDLILDHYDPTNFATPGYLAQQPAQLILNPPLNGAAPAIRYVDPSSSPKGFDTKLGAVRDGRAGASSNDLNGYPRNIAYLDPPRMDTVDPVTNMSRYRSMAINSAPRPGAGGKAGENGYGQVVYINNTTDIQNESSKLLGGYTLVDEWLNRNAGQTPPNSTKGKWVGDIYVPPGVEITFGRLPQAATGHVGEYGVTLVRNDVDGAHQPILWPDKATGNPGNSSILYIPFTEFAHGPGFNWDVVIVAEGNVRVHGIVSADPNNSSASTDDTAARHVTIVTNATAYIDGSLLKGNPASSIAVLARDYVCVNTTQFTAGTEVTNPNSFVPGVVTSPPSSAAVDNALESIDFTNPNTFLIQEFSFAFPNGGTAKTNYGASNLALYFSGQSSVPAENAMATFALHNPRTQSSFGVTPANPNPTDNTSAAPANFTSQTVSQLLHTTIPISGLTEAGTSIMDLRQDEPLQLWTGDVNPGIIADPNSTIKGSVYLERVAILPMDVRIEAVLYAQNKSFFVIPGQSFNTDTADTINNYGNGKTVDYVSDSASNNKYVKRGTIINNADPNFQQQRYPFAGQPIDLRITVSGSVSEARPADISAQNAWMQKWGWIPQFHGSMIGGKAYGLDTPIPAELAGHQRPVGSTPGPATGLSIIYDPQCALPYSVTPAGVATPFRMDANGYPLPFAPRLPVCAGMLYVGQAPNDRP